MTEKNTLLAKTEVLTNSAEFGIINQREFFDHDIVNENNIGGYYIVRERDFVYNPRISASLYTAYSLSITSIIPL